MNSLSTGETFTYDANGNMTTRVEGGVTYSQVFDAENHLVSMSGNGQTIQFLYDGDGNLVKQVYPDGSKTLYVGGGYEIDKNSGGSITSWMRYYPMAGAMRVNDTPYWALKDHLGSASVVTNASGTTVGEQRFTPYGETRLFTGSMYTDILFTGQREITYWNIYHYGARFYSPKLGRFLSADTIVPGYGNPQNLNRYMYVLGNPLRYTDPTGHAVACNPMEDDCHDPDPAPDTTPSPTKPKNDDPPDPNPTGLGFQLPTPTITPPEGTPPCRDVATCEADITLSILELIHLVALDLLMLVLIGEAIAAGPMGWIGLALVSPVIGAVYYKTWQTIQEIREFYEWRDYYEATS